MFSFYNMYRSVLISAVLGWGLLSHSPVAEASDGIIRSCSGCTSLQIRQMVKSGPLGYVYVIDYENVELSLWRNTNGGEAGGLNWVEKLTVEDRKSVVEGKSVSDGVDLGGRRIITK